MPGSAKLLRRARRDAAVAAQHDSSRNTARAKAPGAQSNSAPSRSPGQPGSPINGAARATSSLSPRHALPASSPRRRGSSVVQRHRRARRKRQPAPGRPRISMHRRLAQPRPYRRRPNKLAVQSPSSSGRSHQTILTEPQGRTMTLDPRPGSSPGQALRGDDAGGEWVRDSVWWPGRLRGRERGADRECPPAAFASLAVFAHDNAACYQRIPTPAARAISGSRVISGYPSVRL